MSMSNTTKRVKEIRRKTRRKFSSEEKIRIVLEGLRGESSIAELCRREGINSNLYYRWSKDFLGAGSGTNGPLAVAVIGGLVSSTLLTLVVIPSVNSLVQHRINRFHKTVVQ